MQGVTNNSTLNVQNNQTSTTTPTNKIEINQNTNDDNILKNNSKLLNKKKLKNKTNKENISDKNDVKNENTTLNNKNLTNNIKSNSNETEWNRLFPTISNNNSNSNNVEFGINKIDINSIFSRPFFNISNQNLSNTTATSKVISNAKNNKYESVINASTNNIVKSTTILLPTIIIPATINPHFTTENSNQVDLNTDKTTTKPNNDQNVDSETSSSTKNNEENDMFIIGQFEDLNKITYKNNQTSSQNLNKTTNIEPVLTTTHISLNKIDKNTTPTQYFPISATISRIQPPSTTPQQNLSNSNISSNDQNFTENLYSENVSPIIPVDNRTKKKYSLIFNSTSVSNTTNNVSDLLYDTIIENNNKQKRNVIQTSVLKNISRRDVSKNTFKQNKINVTNKMFEMYLELENRLQTDQIKNFKLEFKKSLISLVAKILANYLNSDKNLQSIIESLNYNNINHDNLVYMDINKFGITKHDDNLLDKKLIYWIKNHIKIKLLEVKAIDNLKGYNSVNFYRLRFIIDFVFTNSMVMLDYNNLLEIIADKFNTMSQEEFKTLHFKVSFFLI